MKNERVLLPCNDSTAMNNVVIRVLTCIFTITVIPKRLSLWPTLASVSRQHQKIIAIRTRPMSLYYEAATVLANPEKIGGSLKSRIYKNKELKSSPAQLFALISEASKWSLVLKDVIERCGLLAEEKKVRILNLYA